MADRLRPVPPAGGALDVVVLGTGRWHADQVVGALRALGLSAERREFQALGLGAGSCFPGLEPLPRAILVRAVAAGTFEQVTLRLSVLHEAAARGVVVVNDAGAIERCVDKARTSAVLDRAGLPTPPFWAVERRADAARLLAGEGRLVLKPLFGAQGKGLRLLTAEADIPPPEAVAGVYYLQRYVGQASGWHDHRVLVVGDEAIAMMCRRGASWITNIRQGAVPEEMALEPELAELAVAASRSLGTQMAGVDLMRDPQGRLQILEVNSMPAWSGLQRVTERRIAEAVAVLLQRVIA